ncbi:dickkopf-related protein 1b [Polymixia lowei]
MLRSLMFAIAVYLSVAVITSVCSGSVIVNSNAIKNLPHHGPGIPTHGGGGHTASSSPEEFSLLDGGSHNLLIDPIQSLSCSVDDACGSHGFCFAARGACLPCKRRRKRCSRDAMCCPGNQCSNGVCLPMDSDIVQQFIAEMDPTVTSSSSSTIHADNGQEENSTVYLHPETAVTQDLSLTTRGLEGDRCLRSSDCSEGLCCARHFWSKICKPVLREGQVCTKHRKKGALGLEIFQRCDCGEGLVCRTQRVVEEHRLNKAARSLHTCQRH